VTPNDQEISKEKYWRETFNQTENYNSESDTDEENLEEKYKTRLKYGVWTYLEYGLN
jgi:hypothetical protein